MKMWRKRQIGEIMTNSEMIDKLKQAQQLLADVYDWADTPMSNGLQIAPAKTNAEIASLLSTADSCIWAALDEFDYISDDYDGQPDEAQEWHDFDPDC
jgi:hypothetical protein